jgi:DNA-binding response OmpR family regulator
VKLLVVDDDVALLSLVSFALRQAGYLVVEAADGPAALRQFERELPDLVILDANLPGLSGFEVLRQLRAAAATPVMMLTVRNTEEDEVHGLDLGADDYLTKPFSPRTLLARVRALLRRGEAARTAPEVTGAGDLALDGDNQAVTILGGSPVHLTGLEYRLLQLLLANAGRPVTGDRLTQHVWGFAGTGDRQLLKQLVHRLRQKLEPDPANPAYVQTVPGVGYRLTMTRRDSDAGPVSQEESL